jgi:hypothetical protein
MTNKRCTLSEEEKNIINHFRNTGTIPDTLLLSSDKSHLVLTEKYSNMKKKYEIALKELDNYMQKEEVFNNLKSMSLNNGDKILKIGSLSPKLMHQNKSESVAFSIASDWHYGEIVDPETINGLNEFNMEVAIKRTKQYFERTLYLVKLMRNETQIDTLVLALLGDLISGYIHEELMEAAVHSPTESVIVLVKVLKEGIDYLTKYGGFNKIIIPCAFGNHGRTCKEKRISTAYKNSYEYILYIFMSMLYDKNPNVEFHISKGHLLYRNVFNKYLIRFHHGDLINYGGGVGGITIPVNKAIAQWNRSKTAYMDVFGHFHQLKDGGNWISNASLIGFNAYAESIKADFELPRQAFFTVEKNKGKTFTAPIFLEGAM